jgi:hypothetical protein
MFKELLTNVIQEQKNANKKIPSITLSRSVSNHKSRHMDTPSTTSIEENILKSVKEWWNTTSKTDADIDTLINNKTTIDGYTFNVSSGHQANIFAKKNNASIHIISAGYPDSREEFNGEVMRQLNRKKGGKKRKNKSKKRRSSF